MSETPVDSSKRTWIITSACAGAVGGVAAAVPFVSTFQPSEKAKAAGAAVEVDISALQPGEMKTVEWRGKPVWVLRRTKQQLEELSTLNSELADPIPSASVSLPPSTPRTNGARSSPNFRCWLAFAPTWAARPPANSPPARSPRCPMTGKAVSSALATVRHLTWPVVCSRTSRHRTTWKCPPTCTCQTRSC